MLRYETNIRFIKLKHGRREQEYGIVINFFMRKETPAKTRATYYRQRNSKK
jgi:hypothetical protein